MTEQQRQILKKRELHGDEAGAQANKINDRSRIRRGLPATRSSKKNKSSQKRNDWKNQRANPGLHSFRQSNGSFCGEVKRAVVENGRHACRRFGNDLIQSL